MLTLFCPRFAPAIAQRAVPPAKRERLEQVVRKIDEINSRDPTRVSVRTVWGTGVDRAGEMLTRIFRRVGVGQGGVNAVCHHRAMGSTSSITLVVSVVLPC